MPSNADERGGLVMRLWRKSTQSPRRRLLTTLLILAALTVGYWILFPGNGSLTSTAGVLVLEDSDSDYKTPPFDDAVILFGPDGKPGRKVGGLNICETVGGCRSLSVSGDGRIMTVCENVTQSLTAYELPTGKKLWSLKGDITSATVAPNGLVYALATAGTIQGKDALVINQQGQIVKQAPLGGFDLALDAERGALWLVGKTVKKCDLDLKVLLVINPTGWCAVSVDFDRDGSVWVAERAHPNVTPSTNRIFKISSDGKILKSIGLAFEPLCLRVDRSEGGVWVTGIAIKPSAAKPLLDSLEKRVGHLPTGKALRDYLTRSNVQPGTRKYDSNGALQCELSRGGFSLDLDSADGSVWIGGSQRVYRYSRQGKLVGQSKAGPSNEKYVAVVPGTSQSNAAVRVNGR